LLNNRPLSKWFTPPSENFQGGPQIFAAVI